MKYASVTLIVLGLLGVGFTACATGDRPEFGNQPSGAGGAGGEGGSGGDNSGGITSSSSSSSSSATTGSGGAQCTPSCTIDTECQSTCPVPQAGINCCDTGTNTCYVSGSSACPSTGTSGSGGSPY